MLEAEKAANPARLSWFRVDVTVPPLDARHQEGVLRAVKKWLIHNTLLHTPHIAVSINSASLPALAA